MRASSLNHLRATGLALGAALAFLAGCSAQGSAPVRERTPVRMARAASGPAAPPIRIQGVVANKDEMRLSFKVGGIIQAIYVEEGMSVRKGQRLAQIEPAEINAEVEQVRARAEKAQRDLARGERLYADQVVSLEQLEDLRTQARAAAAQLTSVEFNRGYATILAPHDGVVLRKLAQERELVPAGQAVLALGAHDRGYVIRAALADRDVVQLALGDVAQIRLDAYPDRVIPGTLSEIANAADEHSGLFPIEVRIDSPPAHLASGLVAKLELVSATARAGHLTYVPIGAIVEASGGRASVFVLEGERAKRRPVRVAFVESTAVALSSGLNPGEPVATDGALYLTDGERVEVVPDAPAAADLPARGE
jgi:RND family efflux transporter MFP subunit